MQISEVTIFKLILFAACVVLITIFVVKIGFLSDENLCQTLIVNPEVASSVIADVCPEGFYPNFGEFKDVKEGHCCVRYAGD